MIKEICITLSCTLLCALLFVGCAARSGLDRSSSKEQESISSQKDESGDKNTSKQEQSNTDLFAGFQTGLNNLNITYTAQDITSEVSGTKQAMRYLLDSGSIDVYEFEEGSEEFKQITESKEINLLSGATRPVIIKNQYALSIEEGFSNYDEIVSLFESL